MLTSHVSIPSLSDGNFAHYIDKIKAFPVLSSQEEFEVATRWYEQKSINDAHTLVKSHLRLVVKIATGFKNYGLPLMELIMEGNLGLMQAVKKFNPKLGFRLTTYAIWWIKASIKDYILKSWSFVKIGTTQAQRKLFFSLRKIKNKIAKWDTKSALSDQNAKIIADQCSVPVQEVIDMNKRLSHRDESLNKYYVNGDGRQNTELQDTIPSPVKNQEEQFLIKEEKQVKEKIINDALNTLNDRYRDILVKRKLLEDPVTLEVLSQEYNISRERVRQIELQAFNKVKKFIEENKDMIAS